jgi:hypothetical protein
MIPFAHRVIGAILIAGSLLFVCGLVVLVLLF